MPRTLAGCLSGGRLCSTSSCAQRRSTRQFKLNPWSKGTCRLASRGLNGRHGSRRAGATASLPVCLPPDEPETVPEPDVPEPKLAGESSLVNFGRGLAGEHSCHACVRECARAKMRARVRRCVRNQPGTLTFTCTRQMAPAVQA